MPPKTDLPTRYVELVDESPSAFGTPFGPGYQVAFDETIDTAGYNEIRLWVHVFVDNYAATPITSGAKLAVRFMHVFSGGSFDYEERTIDDSTPSYLNGYCAVPIIGDRLRLLGHPTGMPPGPFRLQVTYYLIR